MKLLHSAFLLLLMPTVLIAGDWTFWRGPEFNGQSRETGLIDDWNPKGGEGSNVAWVRTDLKGRSTPIVMNGRLYTIQRANPETAVEGERVVCINAKTGKDIWEQKFNVYLSDVPDTRVGWSSCLGDPETGHVYALGVCGLFQCFDGATGEVLWKVPLHENFGLLSTYGGRTNFPVICDDLVIISGIVIGWGDMAKPAHRFIGFDKKTGKVVWFRGTRDLPYDTTYSSPTITVLDGQKALVAGSGDGAVWAMQPRTGNPIWEYRFSRRGLNVSPLVYNNMVFSSHSEENIVGTAMGSVVGIDALGSGNITDSNEMWKLDEIMAGKSSPTVINDNLYVIDDRAKLHVFDTESGDRVGRRLALGTAMRSSPLVADGKIYTLTADSRWHILEPNAAKGVKKLKSGRLLDDEESHASPICANGRIYIQTSGRLYCLADPSKTPGWKEAPQPAKEADISSDQTAAHLQLVPAELLLKPGDTQTFEANLFNARGQFLKKTKAKLSVNAHGTVNDQSLTLAANAPPTAVTVTAEAEGITGSSRVRIVPPLPWKYDFEDVQISPRTKSGEPPIQWVGARYRHVVREIEGNKVMVKVTTIPKGARSRCWFGQPSLHDYTIQADIRGAINNEKMPDIGLIAQGYAIDLQGANQQLQIRSWVPQLRMASTIDFPRKPDTWYTMKLRAETSGSIVVLKG